MAVTIELKQIISIIKEKLNINYRVVSGNNIETVTPASIKNHIDKGLYYLTEEFSDELSKITNSIVITNFERLTENTLVIVDNPQLVYYKILNELMNNAKASIHPNAIIHPEAKIAENVSIGAFCVVGNCIIEQGVQLQSNVVIKDNVVLKSNVYIDSNSCIGAAGLAWIWDDSGNRVLQPQTGGVVIENDCYLGTDVTVVKGSTSENTVIGKGTLIAHGTKIGHGAQVGAYVHMANNVSLAGNAVIGNRSFLGSASVVSSNIIIPENTIVGAGAVVNKNYEETYCTLVGVPAKIISKKNYLNKPKGVPKPFKNKE